MRYLFKEIEITAGKAARLVLFSDTHDGSAFFARKTFRQFLRDNMEDAPDSYLMGLGDQLDCIVPADIKRFQLSIIDPKFLVSPHPDEVLDAQAKDFVELLDPYKDRLIGLAEGNHEEQIRRRYGTNIHRRICNELGCENLGRSFLMVLRLRTGTVGPRSIRIYGHHGHGGGSRTAGGNLTKYAYFLSSYDADIYLAGHSHDLWVKKIARIGINENGKMQHKNMVLANTGTFAKTLSDTDVPSWEETKGFPPRLLGGLVLELTPEPSGMGRNGWIEVKVME